MGDKTEIAWTDSTWNPTTGCDRISPGCDHCYALTMAGRLKLMGQARYQTDGDPATSGPGFGFAVHPAILEQPLRWKRPRRIFVNSMSDLFHKQALDEVLPDRFDHEWPFLAEAVAVMVRADWHVFQVLTKRPQLMAAVLAHPHFRLDVNGILLRDGHEVMPGGMSDPDFRWPKHLWWGTSIENDRYAFRANHLRAVGGHRFLSLEPLLADLPSLDLTGIDWVIIGGESGSGARPMEPDWALSLIERCQAASVPVFMKQAGAVLARQWGCRQPAGAKPDEWPAEFRVRDFPGGDR